MILPSCCSSATYFRSWRVIELFPLDYLTRVNRFFESRDTNISETILLVKCYTKLAQLLMDVVGSVAKFSRRENGVKGVGVCFRGKGKLESERYKRESFGAAYDPLRRNALKMHRYIGVISLIL